MTFGIGRGVIVNADWYKHDILLGPPSKNRLPKTPRWRCGTLPWQIPRLNQPGRSSMTAMTGGCLCGKVRYTVSADPMFTGVCHCTSCQKQGGGAFSVVIGVPTNGLSVEGTTTTYEAKGDSGQSVKSRFCPVCGSTIVSEPEVMQGLAIVRAGTLDDPSSLKPTMEIYCDSKQPWVSLGGDLKAFPKMPG